MVEEAYVSFEIAKLLKEKGFNESISTAYLCCDGRIWDKRFINMSDDIHQDECYNAEDTVMFGRLLLAPTQQMAMRWLREKCEILLWVYPIIPLPVPKKKNEFYWKWDGKKQRHSASFFRNGEKKYKSYEEACEEAIKFCLENLEEIDYE